VGDQYNTNHVVDREEGGGEEEELVRVSERNPSVISDLIRTYQPN